MECHRKTATEDKLMVDLIQVLFLECKKIFFRSDPGTKQILESMRSGAINIKQAAEALGMEPAMLAYQLAGRVSRKMSHKMRLWVLMDKMNFSQLVISQTGTMMMMTLLRMRTSTMRTLWRCSQTSS